MTGCLPYRKLRVLKQKKKNTAQRPFKQAHTKYNTWVADLPVAFRKKDVWVSLNKNYNVYNVYNSYDQISIFIHIIKFAAFDALNLSLPQTSSSETTVC